MTTAQPPAATPSGTIVGQTVHYRSRGRCWAAAIVERGPGGTAQLFLFPLPPSFPMPPAPGTFVDHDAARAAEESWHRLTECRDAGMDGEPRQRRRSRKAAGA